MKNISKRITLLASLALMLVPAVPSLADVDDGDPFGLPSSYRVLNPHAAVASTNINGRWQDLQGYFGAYEASETTFHWYIRRGDDCWFYRKAVSPSSVTVDEVQWWFTDCSDYNTIIHHDGGKSLGGSSDNRSVSWHAHVQPQLSYNLNNEIVCHLRCECKGHWGWPIKFYATRGKMIIVLHIVRYKYQVVYNANGGTGGPGTITTGWLDGTTGEDTFSYATAYKLTTAGGRGVWDYFDSNTDLNGVPSDMKPNAASKWIQMSKDFDIPSTQPTRSGYHFDGWSYTQNGSKISGTINVSASGTGNINTTISRTVYARWIPWYKYSLTFDPNGGTGGPGTVTSEEQETTSYSFVLGGYSTPTRKGYTFDGWYDAASGGNKVTTVTLSNSTVGSTASTTVYAHWAKNAYTATFNPAEGSVSPSSQTYYVDTPFTFPKPTRTGYKCTGWKVTSAAGDWTLNQTYSCESASPSNYIGDVTFTAQWATQYKYDLTYDYNGGCKGVSPNLTYSRTDSSGWIDDASYTFTNSVMYNSSSYPWRTGWHISGWYSDAAGTASVSQVTLTGTPAQTVSSTVYAIWYVDLTGSIDHGTVTNSSQSVKEGKNSAAMVFTPATGYRITDVKVNDASQSLSYPLETYTYPAQTLTQATEVTATASLAIYTITFDPDGGSVSPATLQYKMNEDITLPQATKEGKSFTGWKVTTAAGNWSKDKVYSYQQGKDFVIPQGMYGEGIVLTAVYDDVYYTVKGQFADGSHGTVTGTNPQSIKHGTNASAISLTADEHSEITALSLNGTAIPDVSYPLDTYTYTAENVKSDITVTATTTLKKYTVSVSVDEPSLVTVSGTNPQDVTYGTKNSPVKVSAVTGYEITGVKVNGTPVSGSFPVKEYTFEQTVTGATSVVVSTGVKTYSVTLKVNGLSGEDSSILRVYQNGSTTASHSVVLSVGKPQVTVKNIQEGTSVKVELTGWTWTYTVESEKSQTKTVSGDTDFSFYLMPIANLELHSEKGLVI